jgi:hypothetical protein
MQLEIRWALSALGYPKGLPVVKAKSSPLAHCMRAGSTPTDELRYWLKETGDLLEGLEKMIHGREEQQRSDFDKDTRVVEV